MIPKIIHYCWFGPNKMSKTDLKCIKSWKKHLPEYKLMLWNEDNSPIDVPFVKAALKAKKYAFSADYVRIWALNKYGGVYMDTDMLALKNLDSFLDCKSFLGKENENTCNAAIMGCEKECTFISNVFERYNNLSFSIENIQNIAIPKIITEVINTLTDIDKPIIYPPDVFYPLPFEATSEGIFDYKQYLTENSVAVHLWNASWLDELNEYRKQSHGWRKYWNIIKAHIKKK